MIHPMGVSLTENDRRVTNKRYNNQSTRADCTNSCSSNSLYSKEEKQEYLLVKKVLVFLNQLSIIAVLKL